VATQYTLSSLSGRRRASRRRDDRNIAAAASRLNRAVSGLVTLTFDLLTLKVVSESCVLPLCQFWSS